MHRDDPALLPSAKGGGNTKAGTAVPTHPASLIGRLKSLPTKYSEQKLFWEHLCCNHSCK